MSERRVVKVVTGHPTSDGAGVRLTRVLGTPALDQLDPFLLLDEFKSDRPDDYLAGFPDHPAPRLRDRHLHAGRGDAAPRTTRATGASWWPAACSG